MTRQSRGTDGPSPGGVVSASFTFLGHTRYSYCFRSASMAFLVPWQSRVTAGGAVPERLSGGELAGRAEILRPAKGTTDSPREGRNR